MLYDMNNLVKRFDSRIVLDIPALSLEPRKVYALIGPNGAGKTTLLNQLAFLDQPTSGELRFRDNKVGYERSSLTRLRKHVVLVDQSPILFSGSVWKNVEFGLKVRGISKQIRSVKVRGALERVGMSDFALSDVHGLSGGEVKRLALARALAVDPDVLLCDEPTANVDREHQEIILKILAHANSVRNTSVIFSTHYLSQSRRLAHHTILLQNGQLADERGENSFSGRVMEDAAGKKVFRLMGKYDLPLDSADLPADTTDLVQVHINPKRLLLLPSQEEEKRGAGASGTVSSITAENGNVRLIVDIGAPLHVLMDTRHYRLNPLFVGQQVEVGIPEEALTLIQ